MTNSPRARRICAVLTVAAILLASGSARAGLLDALTSPKTLIDRAIEARSASYIVEDNRIVIAVNKIMADLGTIKASTEIYEQRLLITGILDDRKVYDKFFAKAQKLKNVKRLYWRVTFMSKKEQERNKERMLDWADAIVLDAKVGVSLVATRGVADVNYRVAVDAFSAVYLLGRARSQAELRKALKASQGTTSVKKLVNYVERCGPE